MVLDTSALIAIILAEPEMASFSAIVADAKTVRISAASYVEASIVLAMRGQGLNPRGVEEFVRLFGIQIEPVTAEQARLASSAFLTFGKGLHPARLNYGDCFTYALAKAVREPLLYKGNDFAQTDIEPALKPMQ